MILAMPKRTAIFYQENVLKTGKLKDRKTEVEKTETRKDSKDRMTKGQKDEKTQCLKDRKSSNLI